MRVQLGNSSLHESHTTAYSRGFCVCLKCFAYGSEAPRRLARPCEGRAVVLSPYAREMLGRLGAGRTPRSGLVWPRPDEIPAWRLLRAATLSPGAARQWVDDGLVAGLLTSGG